MSELYLDNIERYDYSGSGVYQNPLDPLVPPILLNTASVNNPIILNSDGRDTLQLTQDFYFKALNGGNRSFLWSQLCNDYCSSIMGGAGADIPVFIQGIMKLECTPMISPLYYLFRNLKLNWANIIDNKPTNGDIYTIEHIFSSVSDNLKISFKFSFKTVNVFFYGEIDDGFTLNILVNSITLLKFYDVNESSFSENIIHQSGMLCDMVGNPFPSYYCYGGEFGDYLQEPLISSIVASTEEVFIADIETIITGPSGRFKDFLEAIYASLDIEFKDNCGWMFSNISAYRQYP